LVQWVRLCAPNSGGPGSIPGQGTRPHMPQEFAVAPTNKKQKKRSCMQQLKILSATTSTAK